MIKNKSLFFSFLTKNIKIKLFLKTIFFYFIGVYILTLPIFTIKFNLIDGLNIYGFISSKYVLLTENIFCIVLSSISFICCFYSINKIIGEIRKDDKK
jgi:hypothetical protein